MFCTAQTPQAAPVTAAADPAVLDAHVGASWPDTGLVSPLHGWGGVGASRSARRPGPEPSRVWAFCTPQGRDCPADLQTVAPELAFSSYRHPSW